MSAGAISNGAPPGSLGRYLASREAEAKVDEVELLRDIERVAVVMPIAHGGRARARAALIEILGLLDGR